MDKSYNGWPASLNPADFGGIETLTVAGESFAPGVRAGDVATILGYVAQQMHARVEPVYSPGWHEQDDWGYSYRPNRNANNLSCHSSGTAIDYNATRHPNGKRGTFNAAQVAEIKKILGEVDGVVSWGGAWAPTSVPDEMHFEIDGDAAQVAKVAARIRSTSEEFTVAQYDEIIARFEQLREESWKQHSDSQTVRAAYHAQTQARIAGLTELVGQLQAGSAAVDLNAIEAAGRRGAETALKDLRIQVNTGDAA